MDAPKAAGAEIGARITRRASDRLRGGHLWVYASDIESIRLPDDLPDGGDAPALLPVADNRGVLLGTALYSPESQIALRMIAREAVSESQWLEMLAERLRMAIGRRKRLLNAETDSARLCFSEADDLPGVVVDKYAGLVILQLLAKGLDSKAVRGTCVRVLREELDPSVIVERPDPRMRELEGLSAPGTEPLFVREGSKSGEQVEFLLNGLKFHFDANSGQKTGAFLDQRSNYAAVRDWAARLGATGRALDVCTYQGGFALHLAEVCEQVTGLDASHSSLEVAERNLETNRSRLKATVDWIEADAFQLLRDWSDKGEKLDAIVLDPPAFAKTQRAVEGALRGYKEMNLRALRMLRPGGLLATFSCSHHVEWVDLEAAVASAAHDAGRRVRVLERRGASLDHPVVLNLPETEYLKCLVLEVE
jgi:23S rRNA (cytosine1962-C5)-methyltransferase